MDRVINRFSGIFGLIVLTIFSCNSKQKNTSFQTEPIAENKQEMLTSDVYLTKGYELMQQKCFICHMEKPDPVKRNSMIAPPMLRVQEHYKPVHPDRNDFVKAITAFVKEPSVSNTLMPGAIRKFDLMAKLPYEDADLKLIAGALYDIDFGKMPKMRMGLGNGLQLDQGKKWKVYPRTMEKVEEISKLLEQFQSDDLSEYQTLGRTTFNEAKTILLDDAYSGAIFDQIHYFFYSIEEPMHLLIASRSLKEAKEQHLLLKNKFEVFPDYFQEY